MRNRCAAPICRSMSTAMRRQSVSSPRFPVEARCSSRWRRRFSPRASPKSAEPNTLVVMVDLAARDALIEDDPQTYYLQPHYVDYPCVLVRLSRIHAEALRDLITGAHHFVGRKAKRTRTRRS